LYNTLLTFIDIKDKKDNFNKALLYYFNTYNNNNKINII